MPARPVIIKKYENRRLYDTSNSRYVNLEDIAQIVREGTEVRVVDAATGEDLTRFVLTQIVVESAKAPNSAFPLDMLRQMIVASGQVSREGLLGYMKAMVDMYQNTYRAFAPGLSPFDFVQPKPGPGADEAPPPDGSAAPPGAQPSVEELRRRVEELERLIPKSTAARPAAKRKRTARAKR
ncbi:MAG: polyhydroxyalkanoate synthesis regulator DNA-binding domain-containing protein [Bryobacteraceae bacterium]